MDNLISLIEIDAFIFLIEYKKVAVDLKIEIVSVNLRWHSQINVNWSYRYCLILTIEHLKYTPFPWLILDKEKGNSIKEFS